MSDWYQSLGVSAHKQFLEGAIRSSHIHFAPILPDPTGDPAYRFALHADGVGTKGVLAYLWWRETGDSSVWAALAQDALVMNTDDLVCSGITEGFVFSTTLTRNPFHIPDAVIQALIEGVYGFVEKLNSWGIPAWVAGGETADMPDVTRTLGVEATVAARVRADQLLPLRRPDREIAIVGLGSDGRATYESAYNSGIGCNGITAIRHLLLAPEYASQYPETVAPELSHPYQGKWRLTDTVSGYTLGYLLTSPTRTYLPLLRDLLQSHRKAIYALIHCTGGGQRKALKYLPYTLIRKENFFPLPPLFRLLTGLRPWHQLYEVVNMGHRMEIYTLPEIVGDIIALAKAYQIPAQQIGTATPIDSPTRIEAQFGEENWVWT